MLQLLQDIGHDISTTILSRRIVVTGSAIVVSLASGMMHLQGAEDEGTTDRAIAVGDSDQPAVRSQIPRPPASATGGVPIRRDKTAHQAESNGECPHCIQSHRQHGRHAHHQSGCGNPGCASCCETDCPAGHIPGCHPYVYGQLAYSGGMLHACNHGCNHSDGAPLHGWLSGGYYGVTHVMGSPSVERVTGVGCMRISEWPSPCTGLTLTEEQNMYVEAGHCAACQPFCRPAYMNIPDHVWD